MEFKNAVPTWNATGVEPPDSLKNSGFRVNYKPPADYFNWQWYRTSKLFEEIVANLSNVDNTADKDKPVSTAQAEAIENATATANLTGITPVLAYSTDGIAYTATVEGVTELYDGLKILLLPEINSATTSPTLNVNGLGDIRLGMLSSFNNAAVVPAPIATWLSKLRPVEVTFHQMRSTVTNEVTMQYWIVDWRRPSASSLYGQVPVQNGGWYINSNTTEEDKEEMREALAEIGISSTLTATYEDGCVTLKIGG